MTNRQCNGNGTGQRWSDLGRWHAKGSRLRKCLRGVYACLNKRAECRRKLNIATGIGSEALGFRNQCVVDVCILAAIGTGYAGHGNNPAGRTVREWLAISVVAEGICSRAAHIGAWIRYRRNEVGTALEAALIGGTTEIAITCPDGVAFEVIDNRKGVEFVFGKVAKSTGQADAFFVAIVVRGAAATSRKLQPLEVAPQYHVDYTRQCVGAIDGRSTVFQDFDTINGGERDAVQINKCILQILRKAKICHAATVNQGQRAALAEAAQ